MGLEAHCQAQIGQRTVGVKALLESDELILRGEHRARLAFSSLDAIEVAAASSSFSNKASKLCSISGLRLSAGRRRFAIRARCWTSSG